MNMSPARQRGLGRRLLRCSALGLAALICLAAAPPKNAPKPEARTVQDMSSILGPGSQLEAAKDGEFTIMLGDDGQLSSFRAVKDVIVLTKDIDCRCDELIYRRAEGKLIATAKPGRLVKIVLRNMNPTMGIQTTTAAKGGTKPKGKGQTYATCRRYEFYINQKKHILSINPVIYHRGPDGKEMAISGDVITLTQDKAGRWQMFIKGGKQPPRIFDPKRKGELDRARRRMRGGGPMVSVNLTPPKPPAPKAAPGARPRPVKIDEGNVGKLKPTVKPKRVVRLEEGG